MSIQERPSALIIGGTKGIGRAIAKALAFDGYALALAYRQDHTAAKAAAAEFAQTGTPVMTRSVDVSRQTDVADLFSEVAATIGPPKVVIHGPVRVVTGPLLDLKQGILDEVIGVNACSLVYCAQQAAQYMTGGGSLITLSSSGATRVIPEYGPIGVSKATLEALVRYLAVELAPLGIRINAVSPGALDTDAFRALYADAEVRLERARLATPGGRTLTLEHVTAAVRYLVSPAAEMIQGQVLRIDGGRTLL